MRGNDYESTGRVVTGHGNGNLNFGWMAKYVSEKIHWFHRLKYFCLCFHAYGMEKGDVWISVIKYCNHLSE